MSTIDKRSTTAQRINYTIAGSAAVSLASLYFNATKIGRFANTALALSIAARVLVGNAESAQVETALVTPSQSSLPFGVDVRAMIANGVNTAKAVNTALRDWALAEKAKQAANQATAQPIPFGIIVPAPVQAPATAQTAAATITQAQAPATAQAAAPTITQAPAPAVIPPPPTTALKKKPGLLTKLVNAVIPSTTLTQPRQPTLGLLSALNISPPDKKATPTTTGTATTTTTASQDQAQPEKPISAIKKRKELQPPKATSEPPISAIKKQKELQIPDTIQEEPEEQTTTPADTTTPTVAQPQEMTATAQQTTTTTADTTTPTAQPEPKKLRPRQQRAPILTLPTTPQTTTTTADTTTPTVAQPQKTVATAPQTTTTPADTTAPTAAQHQETAAEPTNSKYRLVKVLDYLAYFVGADNGLTTTDTLTETTPLVPRTLQEEASQIRQAEKASLQAQPRVACNPYSVTTGTKNQYNLPNGGNTACTSIAGVALLEMLRGKLKTQSDIDQVLETGVNQYRSVLEQLEGFKTEANQTQLLGWDQCYYTGFNKVLQSPEQGGRLVETSIELSPDKNSYLDALQALQTKAIKTKTAQGAILIMLPFTYSVSITPLKNDTVIKLFDSHGSLAYDVLGGSNQQASFATFTSVERLAEYLNAKRPYNPKAEKPEQNLFGLYMCQLRSEAEPTTDTPSQLEPKQKGLTIGQLKRRNARIDSSQELVAKNLGKLQQQAPSSQFLSYCTRNAETVRENATALHQEITGLLTEPPQRELTQLLQKTETLLRQLTELEKCIEDKRPKDQPTITTTASAVNNVEELPEDIKAIWLVALMDQINGWEQPLDEEIRKLRETADNSPLVLADFRTKLEGFKQKIDKVPATVQKVLPEHEQAVNKKLAELRVKLGQFEQLLTQRCQAQVPQPTVVQKMQLKSISQQDLAAFTQNLKTAQKRVEVFLQALQTEAQTAEVLEEQVQKIHDTKKWIESQRQLIGKISDPELDNEEVLALFGKYEKQLTDMQQLVEQKLAIQSASTLEELLKNRDFIKTCEQFLNIYNPNSLEYLEASTLSFINEEVQKHQQSITELQKQAEAIQQKLPQPDQNGQKFQQELKQLQQRLSELQEGISGTLSWNFLPTVTTTTTHLKELQQAPQKYKAQIEKWSESIEKFRATLLNSTYASSEQFLADLLDDVCSLHAEANRVHQSITELQKNQEPLTTTEQLLGQIQTITEQATTLMNEIQQKQTELSAAPTQQPPANGNKPRSRLAQFFLR